MEPADLARTLDDEVVGPHGRDLVAVGEGDKLIDGRENAAGKDSGIPYAHQGVAVLVERVLIEPQDRDGAVVAGDEAVELHIARAIARDGNGLGVFRMLEPALRRSAEETRVHVGRVNQDHVP